jgi:hypothetical protein
MIHSQSQRKSGAIGGMELDKLRERERKRERERDGKEGVKARKVTMASYFVKEKSEVG